MKMKNFKPVLVLSIICVVTALLLGLVNFATKNKIAEQQAKAEGAALTSALDTDAKPEKIEIPVGAKATVKELYEVKDVGYVVRVEGKGYNDTVKITVGVIDLAVNKVIVTYENETHGKSLNPLYDSFVDLEKGDVDGVEGISGATISSGVIKNLIKDALDCVEKAVSGPADESQGIYFDAANKIVEGVVKEELSESAPKEIVESYAAASGEKVVVAKTQGYAAEITVAVGVDNSGKIIKISVIDQAESHGKDMSGFYGSFAGVSVGEIDGIANVSGATISSGIFKSVIKTAVNYATGTTPEEPEEDKLPKTDEELLALVKELTGADGERVELGDDTPDTLKAFFKASGGYVAYTVTSTQYVAVETEALTHFDNNGKVIKSSLITWTVGHGTEPGDLADRFTGKGNDEIGSVELVAGTTGTSEHYRDAVKAASDYVISVTGGKIAALAKDMTGEEGEQLSIDGADAVIKAVYKVSGGYVVYTITSTQYVAKETEVLTYFDKDGKVIKSNLITWTVGHGTEPGDLADRFTGKGNDEIGSVELIAGTTGTSGHYRDAVKAGSDYVLLLERVPNLIKEYTNLSGTAVELSGAPDTLKALYKVDGGYVAYTVTSTQYVAKETEVLTHFDESGTVIKSYLITWTVGHGTEPGDLADRFTGKGNAEIGSVELIVGTTGTSGHYRDAVKAASDYILLNLEDVSDARITEVAGKIFGEDCSFERVDIKQSKFIGAAFKSCNGGYAILIKTATADGERAIEAVVGIKDGKIVGIKLVNDFTEKTDGEPTAAELTAYLASFDGKDIDSLTGVELVGTTDTAKNLKKSIKAALRAADKYTVEAQEAKKTALYNKIDNIIGSVLVAMAIVAMPIIVTVTSVKEKRRAGK